MDGLCVRIAAMRSHSQALTMKLTEDLPVAEIERIIAEDNQWAQVVPNTKDATMAGLTPVAASGSLNIPVGRIRKLAMGPQYISASRWATSCCGVPLSRCAACSRSRSEALK